MPAIPSNADLIAQSLRPYPSGIGRSYYNRYTKIWKAARSMRRPKGSAIQGYAGSVSKFGKARRGLSKKTGKFGKHGYIRENVIAGQIQDSNCVYIGHASAGAITTMLGVMSVALLRKLYYKGHNIDFQSDQDVMPDMTDADIVNVSWVDISNAYGTYQYTITPGTTKVIDVATDMVNNLWQPALNGGKRTFKRIWLTKTSGLTTTTGGGFSLENAKVKYLVASVLKVQNISQGATSSTADVNTVPLTGLGYYGRGNVTGMKGSAGTGSTAATGTRMFYGNRDYGSMIYGAASPLALQAPPHAQALEHVSKSSYTVVNPGVVKKDTLYYRCYKSLNTWLDSLADAGGFTTTISDSQTHQGNFKLFALEKVVHAISTEKPTILYELKQRHHCMFTFGGMEQILPNNGAPYIFNSNN